MGASLGISLIVFSFLAFIAFLVWNRARVTIERRRLELEAQARLLEKIGPGVALTEFLETDAGRRFFESLSPPPPDAAVEGDTRKQILRLTTLGIVALITGFFFIMSVSIPTQLIGDAAPVGGVRFLAMLPVLLLTGSGVGALAAAWIMHRMSKQWRMVGPRASDNGTV